MNNNDIHEAEFIAFIEKLILAYGVHEHSKFSNKMEFSHYFSIYCEQIVTNKIWRFPAKEQLNFHLIGDYGINSFPKYQTPLYFEINLAQHRKIIEDGALKLLIDLYNQNLLEKFDPDQRINYIPYNPGEYIFPLQLTWGGRILGEYYSETLFRVRKKKA